MSSPFNFHEQVAAAEQAAAFDYLQHEFAPFHAKHIAQMEASIRVGAISLLAATGTEVDGTSLQVAFGKRHLYSTGFLLAGEIEGNGETRVAPVVKVETWFKDKTKQYNEILQKSFQRDRRFTTQRLAMRNVGHITLLLQEMPINITAGTICNRPDSADPQWVPFTQTTARRVRPVPMGSESSLPIDYLKRRVLGDVLSGHFRADHIFKGTDPERLESLPASTLPSLNVDPKEVVALAGNPQAQIEVFSEQLAIAAHNEHVASKLFKTAASCATSLARGKLGRLFWYNDPSITHKFRSSPGARKRLDT